MLRAAITGLIALYTLWNMDALPSKWSARTRNLAPLAQPWYEWAILAMCMLAVIGYTFFLSPQAFQQELKVLNILTEPRFDEITKPYFPYFFYNLGYWIGIVFPVFLLFLRSVAEDYLAFKHARDPHEHAFMHVRNAHEAQAAFEEYNSAFEKYFLFLKDVGERYISLLLAIVIVLAIQQLTFLSTSVLRQANEVAKAVIWAMLAPGLLIAGVTVMILFESAARRARCGLEALADRLTQITGARELLDKVLAARSELVWKRSPAAFLFSMTKTGGVAVPLLLAIIGYFARKLVGYTWPDLLLPKAVDSFFSSVFRYHIYTQ